VNHRRWNHSGQRAPRFTHQHASPAKVGPAFRWNRSIADH
jgi:hypothetical protein